MISWQSGRVGGSAQTKRRRFATRGGEEAGVALEGGDVVEDLSEEVLTPWLREGFKSDFVALGDNAGPVGLDDDAIHVACDEERRVAEIALVAFELVEGVLEVFALLLVLPGEVVLAPDDGRARTDRTNTTDSRG
jgi:hypothetical protein